MTKKRLKSSFNTLVDHNLVNALRISIHYINLLLLYEYNNIIYVPTQLHNIMVVTRYIALLSVVNHLSS